MIKHFPERYFNNLDKTKKITGLMMMITLSEASNVFKRQWQVSISYMSVRKCAGCGNKGDIVRSHHP